MALSVWGKFLTVRKVNGEYIPYDLTGEMHEEHVTDGSPRTFTVIARVKSDRAEQFKKAVLPDVEEGSQDTDQQIDIGTAGTGSGMASDQIYYRQKLIRHYPEPHPIHSRAWLRSLSFLRGEGYPIKNKTTHFLDYATWDNVLEARKEGYTLFAMSFQDLPYPVAILGNYQDRAEDNGTRKIPDEDADNIEINSAGHSELDRYCLVETDPRGNNLQLKDLRNFYFVNDDGTAAHVVSGDNSSQLYNIPDQAGVIYVPSTTLTITWFMVPRVPKSLQLLQSHVNAQSISGGQPVIKFPFEVFPQLWPQVGCLLYFNYRVSRPYYTFTEKPVYDITLTLGHRQNGTDGVYRGWNSTWCPKARDYRRFVLGEVTGTTITDPSPLPKTGTGTESEAVVPASKTGSLIKRRNLYEFASLQNLWKFEAPAPVGS